MNSAVWVDTLLSKLEKLHPLSERLAALGIMGAQLRTPPETPQYESAVMVPGVSGGTFMIPRYATASNDCVSDAEISSTFD